MAEVNDPAWYGVVVPVRTPESVVQRLNQALRKVLANPDVRAQLQAGGAAPVGNSPQEFAAEITAELDKMARIAKQQDISFQE